MYTEFAQEGLGSDLALLTYGSPQKPWPPLSVHDAANAYMNSSALPQSLSKERSSHRPLGPATDIALSTDISGRIKCGGMFQRRIRDYDLNIKVARASARSRWHGQPFRACVSLATLYTNKGSPSLANFIQDSYQYGEFLNGEYTLGYPMNINLMLDIWRGRSDGSPGQTTADYTGIRYQRLFRH